MCCPPVPSQGWPSPGVGSAHSSTVTAGDKAQPFPAKSPPCEPVQPAGRHGAGSGRREIQAGMQCGGHREAVDTWNLPCSRLRGAQSSSCVNAPKRALLGGGCSSGEGLRACWQLSLWIKLIPPRHLPWGCRTGKEGVTQIQVTKLTF